MQNNRSLKRVLLSICVGLLLSGCIGDVLVAPSWIAKEVAGGARAHLPTPKLTEAEKAILDKNIARLIEQIKWIDQYNVQNPNNKIYLEIIGNISNTPYGCVVFASVEKLPVMWIELEPYLAETDCFTGVYSPQYGAVFNEQQNVFNNKVYPNLPKYYGVSRSDIFIYALDQIKKLGLAFINIPVRGVDDYFIDPSQLRYVSTFSSETSAVKYLKSIFISSDFKAGYDDIGGYHEGYLNLYDMYKEAYDRYMLQVQPPQN